MPEGAFNVVEFARQMGLKNVREMPIIERIQPVISVGDMEGLTPAQAPPSGVVGKNELGVPTRFGALSIKSLAPGGTRILWISVAGSLTWSMRIVDGNQGFFVGIGGPGSGPPIQIASHTAPQVQIGAGTTGAAMIGDLPSFGSLPSPVTFGAPPDGSLCPARDGFRSWQHHHRRCVCLGRLPGGRSGF